MRKVNGMECDICLSITVKIDPFISEKKNEQRIKRAEIKFNVAQVRKVEITKSQSLGLWVHWLSECKEQFSTTASMKIKAKISSSANFSVFHPFLICLTQTHSYTHILYTAKNVFKKYLDCHKIVCMYWKRSDVLSFRRILLYKIFKIKILIEWNRKRESKN